MSVQLLLESETQEQSWAQIFPNKIECNGLYVWNNIIAAPVKIIQTSDDGKLGFFAAAPHAQGVAGAQASVSAAGATPANTETTYTGGLGASAYSIGQIVLILKQLGLIAQ
jgi:hypothetical protein